MALFVGFLLKGRCETGSVTKKIFFFHETLFINWKKAPVPSPPVLTHGPNRHGSKEHIVPKTLKSAL